MGGHPLGRQRQRDREIEMERGAEREEKGRQTDRQTSPPHTRGGGDFCPKTRSCSDNEPGEAAGLGLRQ